MICPVRNASESEERATNAYVDKLEREGCKVHYPPRDVDQTNDGVGLAVCEAHVQAMFESDEVHVWCNPSSKGSHFDFGMGFLISKIRPDLKFVLIN